jgi:hypothetical protein
MNFFIGMDDTDNAESRGTGHLARQLIACLQIMILGWWATSSCLICACYAPRITAVPRLSFAEGEVDLRRVPAGQGVHAS